MSAIYLPQNEFSSKNRFFYNLYTAKKEYIYHNQLQYHDFYEFQFFFNSANDPDELLGYITLDHEKYPLYHNSIVLIDLFKKHKIDILSKNYNRYCFDMYPDFIHFVSSVESNLMNLFNQATNPTAILHLKEESAAQIFQAFVDLHQPVLSSGNDIYQKGILCLLLANIYDIYHKNSSAGTNINKEDKNMILILQIIQYIDTHIENQLSLEELSDALHFSTYYLCHSFKKYANISLKTYIMDKKINLAKQLLSVYSATEVSEKIGFNNYSSFFRAFKKLTGISPSDYKFHLKIKQY